MTHYLFVDGQCLRQRLSDIEKRYCDGRKLFIDWSRFNRKYTKIYYYDALPAQRPNQTNEEFKQEAGAVEMLHAEIATVDRFRISEGDTRYRSGRGREQKKVDVMIAVDMLVHTIRKNMKEATLLSGDGDFAPLLTALSNEGMFVRLLHPPIASRDLRSAADARELLTVKMMYDLLDEKSREIIGYVSSPSRGRKPAFLPQHLIWKDDDIEIVFRPQEKDFLAIWKSQGSHNTLRGHDLKQLKLVLEDDFSIRIPLIESSIADE